MRRRCGGGSDRQGLAMMERTTSQAEGERVDDSTGTDEEYGHPDVPQTTPSQAEGERVEDSREGGD
ncbi:hypothetical protein AN216_18280 [Streptomyces oceani]|uniref:Uncharacterized protein n=2 Tax=Streptomyces oceani TaxID=1075402 RepID=A0A1E7JZ50_9ACTN|nr:hypothetical protein AN216_18280 [Streptomyces oceani]